MNDSELRRFDKIKISAAVVVVVIAIAVMCYFVFEMPAWMAIAGAFAAIFANGILTLFGKKNGSA